MMRRWKMMRKSSLTAAIACAAKCENLIFTREAHRKGGLRSKYDEFLTIEWKGVNPIA